MVAEGVSVLRSRRFDSGGPNLAEVGEAALLRALCADAPGSHSRSVASASGTAAAEVLIGPGDDAAVWRPPPGHDLVVSQDAVVEGKDFRRSWITPYQLGRRAFAVALSDLSGMGAAPSNCLATLCAASSTCRDDVLAIHEGLHDAAKAVGCSLLGGDLSDIDGPLVVDVSITGTVAPGAFLSRASGNQGDLLAVTGVIGRAAAGLELLRSQGAGAPKTGTERTWLDALLSPPLRVREGLQLVGMGVICGGDMSDGLLVDVERTAGASGCGGELWLDVLPVDDELRSRFGERWPSLAIGGGEDFELLIAAPEAVVELLTTDWPSELAPLTVVGRLTERRELSLLDTRGGEAMQLPPSRARHYS